MEWRGLSKFELSRETRRPEEFLTSMLRKGAGEKARVGV